MSFYLQNGALPARNSLWIWTFATKITVKLAEKKGKYEISSGKKVAVAKTHLIYAPDLEAKQETATLSSLLSD